MKILPREEKIKTPLFLSDFVVKIIVDLVIWGNFLNAVVEHLRAVYNFEVSKSTLRKIIFTVGKGYIQPIF